MNGTGSFGGGAGANGMGVHFGAGVNGLGVHSGIPSMGVGTGGFKGLTVKKNCKKNSKKYENHVCDFGRWYRWQHHKLPY